MGKIAKFSVLGETAFCRSRRNFAVIYAYKKKKEKKK